MSCGRLRIGMLALGFILAASIAASRPVAAARPDEATAPAAALPPAAAPRPATRPVKSAPVAAPPADAALKPAEAQARRLKRLGGVKSWGYQLAGLAVDEAEASPYDLLVVDATTGHRDNRHFLPDEVARLKRKTDGGRRLVVSYLSIGEAEDYRPDYFSPEYISEDAPDWLGGENPQWKGNRLTRFCLEGWQRTILGDEQGRSLYNSIDPSPLYRLIELGFDGVYLDRVDVYSEVAKECPDGARKMVEFVSRLAAHARRRDPGFIVILQNAEELVRNRAMMDAIDAIAKEDLFYGSDHSQNLNGEAVITESIGHLSLVKAAGRPVLVVDYVQSAAKKADARKRIEAQGFIPYIGPRDLGRLWLPGKDF